MCGVSYRMVIKMTDFRTYIEETEKNFSIIFQQLNNDFKKLRTTFVFDNGNDDTNNDTFFSKLERQLVEIAVKLIYINRELATMSERLKAETDEGNKDPFLYYAGYFYIDSFNFYEIYSHIHTYYKDFIKEHWEAYMKHLEETGKTE